MRLSDFRLAPGLTSPPPDLAGRYRCPIGAGTTIGPFVEIRPGVCIGRDVRIRAYAYIAENVRLGDHVVIGSHVYFVNALEPRPWPVTWVREDAVLGACVTVRCGVVIGRGAVIGSGAVVTADVPEHAFMAGVPACQIGEVQAVSRHERIALLGDGLSRRDRTGQRLHSP